MIETWIPSQQKKIGLIAQGDCGCRFPSERANSARQDFQSNVRLEKRANLIPKERMMSSKTEVVRKWYEKSWSNPPTSMIEANEIYLSDDYQGLDKDGNNMTNKASMSAMSQILFRSFEGFKGVVHDLQEEEDGSVTMTFHFEGTHTGDLDLSAMGLGVIPATGKSITTPESKSNFFVEGDQIVKSRQISGGFNFVLAAIGAIPSE